MNPSETTPPFLHLLTALIVKTYLSYPPDKSTDVAILYLPDAFGHELVNNRLYVPRIAPLYIYDQLRTRRCRLADSMAKSGFFVVIPDLFHGEAVPADAMGKGFDLYKWLGEHPPNTVDPIVESTIKALRAEYGVKKLGGVGYCFGGRYVMRFLAQGKGLDAGFAAHPSLVEIPEVEAVAGPLSLAIPGE